MEGSELMSMSCFTNGNLVHRHLVDNSARRVSGVRSSVTHRRPMHLMQFSAFTLIELLVTVSIIALLIAVLVPSLRGARNSAKNVATKATFTGITRALEQFKNDNQQEFRRTNGYPPSARGEDIHEAAPPSPNVLYGAHWLPRHLMGKDFKGFIPREFVPKDCLDRPREWYYPSPCGLTDSELDRRPRYIEADTIKMTPTNELKGQPGSSGALLSPQLTAPVFVDNYDRPILYYVANPFGEVICTPTTSKVDGKIGIYVHEDNAGFTGVEGGSGYVSTGTGFTYTRNQHLIEAYGDVDPQRIDNNPHSFAFYILDDNVHEQTESATYSGTVRPYNSDTYLLISAGNDGAYGTKDDITNFNR